eukprot:902852-Prymnesium_polylepis.1
MARSLKDTQPCGRPYGTPRHARPYTPTAFMAMRRRVAGRHANVTKLRPLTLHPSTATSCSLIQSLQAC